MRVGLWNYLSLTVQFLSRKTYTDFVVRCPLLLLFVVIILCFAHLVYLLSVIRIARLLFLRMAHWVCVVEVASGFVWDHAISLSPNACSLRAHSVGPHGIRLYGCRCGSRRLGQPQRMSLPGLAACCRPVFYQTVRLIDLLLLIQGSSVMLVFLCPPLSIVDSLGARS